MEYLLKSILCLLLMQLFYRLFLQQEVLYRFNRFVLLSVVIGSFFIPLITFEVVQEVAKCKELSLKIKALAKPEATKTIVDEVEKLVK